MSDIMIRNQLTSLDRIYWTLIYQNDMDPTPETAAIIKSIGRKMDRSYKTLYSHRNNF